MQSNQKYSATLAYLIHNSHYSDAVKYFDAHEEMFSGPIAFLIDNCRLLNGKGRPLKLSLAQVEQLVQKPQEKPVRQIKQIENRLPLPQLQQLVKSPHKSTIKSSPQRTRSHSPSPEKRPPVMKEEISSLDVEQWLEAEDDVVETPAIVLTQPFVSAHVKAVQISQADVSGHDDIAHQQEKADKQADEPVLQSQPFPQFQQTPINNQSNKESTRNRSPVCASASAAITENIVDQPKSSVSRSQQKRSQLLVNDDWTTPNSAKQESSAPTSVKQEAGATRQKVQRKSEGWLSSIKQFFVPTSPTQVALRVPDEPPAKKRTPMKSTPKPVKVVEGDKKVSARLYPQVEPLPQSPLVKSVGNSLVLPYPSVRSPSPKKRSPKRTVSPGFVPFYHSPPTNVEPVVTRSHDRLNDSDSNSEQDKEHSIVSSHQSSTRKSNRKTQISRSISPKRKPKVSKIADVKRASSEGLQHNTDGNAELNGHDIVPEGESLKKTRSSQKQVEASTPRRMNKLAQNSASSVKRVTRSMTKKN